MNREIEIMAKTIYGEARGEYRKEGIKALEAVGNVIMNRSLATSFPVSSICLQSKQFSCWNENDPNRKIIENATLSDPVFRICYIVAKKIICGEVYDITGGANHYYSRYIKRIPYWVKGKKPITQIGNHLFFKL